LGGRKNIISQFLILNFEASRIADNIGDKESSSDLETGAEPHRLELEEEFGWRSQQDFGTLYPLFNSPEYL
jgi:hypothetical protein